MTNEPTTPADIAAARKATATYINSVGFRIQDSADDDGWNAAVPLIEAAGKAFDEGDLTRARVLIDRAHLAAFGM